MPDLDFVKNISSTAVYNRGLRYYKQGYIANYEVQKIKMNTFRISGTVRGNYYYDLTINLGVADNGELYYKSKCTCPYDWTGECKHVVAVLIKFFQEDYITLKDNLLRERDYQKLLELSQTREKYKVAYYIKGLKEDNLVNFKVYFKADSSYREEKKSLVDRYIKGFFSGNDKQRSLFSARDRFILKYLESNSYSKGRSDNSYLLPKTEENFLFIKDISLEGNLYFADTARKIKIGDEISLPLFLSGSEERIFLKYDNNYEVYHTNNDDFMWTVRDNIVHPIVNKRILNLPEEIKIPEKNRGEFLFEIIAELGKKYELELSKNLKNYKLVKIEPQIKLELDSKDGLLYCFVELQIGDQLYHGPEILSINLKNKEYSRSKEDKRLWYGKDYQAVRELIEFLEEYEFHVRPDGFFIKDKSDIQEFITNGLLYLNKEWEVKRSESFDQINVETVELKPLIDFTGDSNDNEDGKIDWFEFKILYDLGGKTYSRQEILEMIRYNKQGGAYIHLDNSYYFLQEGKSEENIKGLIKIADQGEESYKSSYYNILYYQKLIEEGGISFQGNRIYNQLDGDISKESPVKREIIPGKVEDRLRNYQKEGYYWLRFLYKYYFAGILADDMGLGKTIQTLTLLESLKLSSPALIICPRTLIYNWGEEIEKFFSGSKYLVYYGTPDEREAMLDKITEYDIIITTYSIISRDYQQLNEEISAFSYCILDEAQYIKNYRTKRAKSVKAIKAERRLALTGTPIENSVEELWSIFDFLMPGYLGTYTNFRKNYLNPIINDNNQKKLTELRKRVAPFILRRKKGEVLRDLPEKMVNLQYVEMTKLQRDAYQLVLEEVKSQVYGIVSTKGFAKSRIHILAALTRLRQICNHPSLVLDNVKENTESGKLDTLLEMVEEGIDGGHNIIIFSQFVKMLKLIQEKFNRNSIVNEYLDGSTDKRMEKVNKFNNNEDIRVFLISLKAGGVGLNLTSADIVIHVDPWWNPMVERQATDRVHRIGQNNKVLVYKMITKGTVEEKMLKLQKGKEEVFNKVIENSDNKVEKITWEEIQELLQFN